jgi:hypothetical protein
MCRWSAVERIDKSIGLKFAQETVIKKTPWFLPLHFGIARLELFSSTDFIASIVGSVKPNSHRSSETWTAEPNVVVILRNRDGITRGKATNTACKEFTAANVVTFCKTRESTP